MCIKPNEINGQLVACRDCWQCKSVKVDNILGRAMAEQSSAVRTDVVTLTYGPDSEGNEFHQDSTILNGNHPRLAFMLLRKAGYKFRYICAGEYGDLKGRAHWHVIFFWYGEPPEVESYLENIHVKWWPHGHTYWDECNERTVRYVCKYVAKSRWGEDGSQTRFSYSKRPALGHTYLSDLAKMHVDQGIVPKSRIYQFPTCYKKDGTRRNFRMTDAMLHWFLSEFERHWYARNIKAYVDTELTNDWRDGIALRQFDRNRTIIQKDRYTRPVRIEKPKRSPTGAKVMWDRASKHWYFNHRINGKVHKIYWTADEGGQRIWQKRVKGEQVHRGEVLEAQAERQRQQRDLPHARSERPSSDTLSWVNERCLS